MKTKQSPVILDLFAGAGGFSLGFHWAGFKTAMAIDHTQQAIETLEANFGHEGTIVLGRDLGTFKGAQLRQYLEKNDLPKKFDIVIGGPPCQGWSKVGRGKIRSLQEETYTLENDPRNKLYKVYLDYIKVFQPKVAVMENVPGMLSHKGINVAELVALGLESAGYNVVWKLINACDFGVPQSRERLFFVGVRKDLKKTFQFPESVNKSGKRVFQVVTVKDAIKDLPIIRNGSKEWVREYKFEGQPSPFASKMRENADSATIFDHVCRNQNDQDLTAFRFLPEGGIYRDLPKSLKRYRDDIFKDKYRKLRWSAPSGCVTAHLSKDCYTHIHPSQARTISVREAARLQSFPDAFYFSGNMGDKFRQIGNAVPPILAEKIASAIKDQVFASDNSLTQRLSARNNYNEGVLV